MEQTNYEMIDLSAEETAELEYDLDKYYDEVYKITEHLHGSVCIGSGLIRSFFCIIPCISRFFSI